MIHYTLLPEKEIKSLKREYRVRLIIFFLFFLVSVMFLGIIALAPAYLFSYSEEKSALDQLDQIQKIREEKGTDTVMKELKDSNQVILKLKNHKSTFVFSKVIAQIITHKTSGLTIRSFGMSSEGNATSTATVIIQGKASTRDSLIQFKEKLQSDPLITSVELPVSDLVKSKDISYSIKVSLIPIP